jgi:tetratricopeptide (TPR) repeat protein
MKKLNVFLSSAMTGELDCERTGLIVSFKTDSALQCFFDLYAIEQHASPRSIQDAYINEVRNSDIFILLLDKQLRSAVRAEFNEARNSNLKIFVYFRNRTDQRDSDLAEFIGQEACQYHYGSFYETIDLCEKVKNDILSDLLSNYYESTRKLKGTQNYIAVSSTKVTRGISLRYFDFDDIKRASDSEFMKDMDSDQLIILAESRSKENGNLKEALLIYEVILFREPSNWQAYNNRGLLLNEMGYQEEAFFSYKRAIELNPDSHATLYNIGIYYRDRLRYDEAIEYYKKALTIKPDKTSALGHLVGIYFSKKDYFQALEYAEKAVSFEENEINLSNLCLALSLTGKKEEALNKAEKLKNTKYYNGTRAYIFYSNGSYDESLKEINLVLNKGNFDYNLAIKKVYCLIYVNRVEEAVDWIKNLESNYYIYPFDYNDIGWVLFEQKLDIVYSYELLKKAVESDPSILESWKNLQCILIKRGGIVEGLSISDRALKYYPNELGIIQNRATFLFMSGKIRQGVSYVMREIARICGSEVTDFEIDRKINELLANVGINDVESFEKFIEMLRKQSKENNN